MIDANRGYHGFSRSIRSQEAIEEYEIPISLFTKTIIKEALNSEYSDFTSEDIKTLLSFTLKQWKDTAKSLPATSWHHTSKMFNKTDHYSIFEVAKEIIENGAKVNEDKSNEEVYAVLRVANWGGTLSRPRRLADSIVYGIVKGNWIVSADNKRYRLTAKRVEKKILCTYLSEALAKAEQMEQEINK